MRKFGRMGWVFPGLLLAAPLAAQGSGPAAELEPATIEVRMVDKGPTRFVFEPADIQVRPGDRVVWVQAGVMPHNVEFTEGPPEFAIAGVPASPFLTMKGQRWELVIDERFEAGRYAYICTPHVAMGMRGTIEVLDGSK
ncbi:MAG: hypothetical protein GWM90_15685 [Gemmatimonadetes bacterium]|nr:hypothetical protein [Gemmatimonadota bacterium]NIQ55657.1 hypothetical protein [Gemmatimonadota bacterium]NIU75860.1 hypothetical protein [Gammaproteobacteria bacterium]NIX45492.1 hypothetical protein [Gemmatimonadota bacterium]NIY09774.1 hypothetical protein [Gemmatimonadota bacterium]